MVPGKRAEDNGHMAGRPGEVLGALLRPEPRRLPSGWALALDVALAVGAATFAVFEVLDQTGKLAITKGPAGYSVPVVAHFGPLVLVVTALTALPLAARRIYPISALLAIIAAISWIRFGDLSHKLSIAAGTAIPPSLAGLLRDRGLVVHHVPIPSIVFGTAVLAAYSAVAYSQHRYLAIAAVAVVTVAVTATFGDTLPQFPGRFTALLAITPAVAAALGIRELRRRLTDSAARLRRATEEYEAGTVRAIEAERARIAGELHDVVTHNVSVMVVQAGAARMAVTSSPDEATDALRAVEASGRTAIAELRNLLGVLSPAGAGVELRPQPGLGELDELISRLSAAGLCVNLLVEGTPRSLPPGADLAAYRVVQEALTNVLRHAGRAATSVLVHWDEKLVITVSNTGGPAVRRSTARDSGGSFPRPSPAVGFGRSFPWASTEPGRGLLGLQERLSLYGGELDAGPRPDGGWQVRAVMPVGVPV
jgi:signal transduction histidine kinase